MQSLFRSFFTVSFYTILSRILGFIRDILIARFLGSTVTSDAFLMARVKAVLRRIRPMFAEEVLSYKGIVVDLVSHSVNRDNETLHLGPTEFNLLVFFMENIGRVFSREQLLNHVWKDEAFVEPRTVDVHIRRLRKAINNDVKEDYIRTVRSAGYSFGS